MKISKFIKKIFLFLIDIVSIFLTLPAAYLMFFYRRAGTSRLPLTTRLLKRIGVFPIINHYYEPLFDDRHLDQPLDADRHLPGVNLNTASQLELLKSLKFAKELIALQWNKPSERIDKFSFNNFSFESGDAEFLYQFLRMLKPQKIVEIGSGHSTKIARLALQRNAVDTNKLAEHVCVEPFEQPWLEKLDGVQIIRERIEKCNFNWANELKSGDFLFIDSSHMVRPQGDVLKEYLEIIPQLAPGVVVHIHDIFTPKDYLKSWVVDDVKFWNEQYILEAMLSNTTRYEIMAGLNYLKHHHYDLLSLVCPYVTPDREPGSFYFRIRDAKVE
jgi:hypothetical protein